MLERWFPNLYGWLVWGGGVHVLRRTGGVAWRAALLLAVFCLGRWSA